LVGKIRHAPAAVIVFRSFAGLARSLIIPLHRSPPSRPPKKGVFEMSAKSQLTRTLVAIAGALLMSTVAVSAAVTPLQATASTVHTPVQAPTYA
jgi:hypothetical protein